VRRIENRQRCSSFLSTVRYTTRDRKSKKENDNHRNHLQMKDASSSYWFTAGDRVEVVSHVTKSGIDLKGRRGQVVETWEKCDVDPTCCCAEFVDDNYAVLVKFGGPIDLQLVDMSNGGMMPGSFTHHFHEDELRKVKEGMGTDVIPFDGMSCTAFKLIQLNMGRQQAQRSVSDENTSVESS